MSFSRLPQDILNEIVDNVQDLNDVKSLRSLALTSHLFVRRSQYHLFSRHVVLSSIEKLDSFCGFLDAHPDRRPWVRSVRVYSLMEEHSSFSDVIPLRLFQNLPNLYQCRIGHSPCHAIYPIPSELEGLYSRVLTHLHLCAVLFQSCDDFVRYILAFPALRHLECRTLYFTGEDDDAALERAKERFSNGSHLSQLTIRSSEGAVFELLLEFRRHALQELITDMGSYRDVELPAHIRYMSKLTSITLEAKIYYGVVDIDIERTTEALQALASVSNSQLAHVTVHLLDDSIFQVFEYLHNYSDELLRMCRALEPAFLRLPRLQKIELVHELRPPFRSRTPMRLEDYLPTLCERGLIDTRCLAPPAVHRHRHSDAVGVLAVSPDEKRIASSSSETTIILWDAQHSTIIHEWLIEDSDDVRLLSFSRDGRYLASANLNRRGMIWDVSEEAEAKLMCTLDSVDVCVWSRDGTMLSFGSTGWEGTLDVWDPLTNEVQFHSLEWYDGERDHTAMFSPDGRWFALFQIEDGFQVWNIWDAPTGRLHMVLPGIYYSRWLGATDATAFDPAGRRIVIPSDARIARIWDIETGDELAVIELRPDEALHGRISFSPDGTRVLSGRVAQSTGQKTMTLWDSFSGDALASFQIHGPEIEQLRFSPDGKYVASASQDRTVKLWDTSDGSCVRTFTEPDQELAGGLVFSPDGEILVSGWGDGMVHIRHMRGVCPESCDRGC